MSTIVTRAGKGSALTYAEVDSNFTNLNTDKYQSGSAASLASLSLSSALPVTSGGTGTSTAFTPGSVVFAGASGVYSQNNTKLFWDNTNSRLGIGTATPSSPLTVYSANNTATIKVTNGLTANNCGITLETLGGNVALNNSNGTCQIIVDGTITAVATAAGEFGINTAAPGATLDVGGSIRSETAGYPNYLYNTDNRIAFGESFVPPNEAGSVVQFGSGANTRDMVFAFSKTGVNTSFFGNDGTQMMLGSEGATPITFRNSLDYFASNIIASGAERMRIDGVGNVGIGTSIPAQKLDVAGNIKTTGTVIGNGVVFPAVQVSSANANTLDDYEEGVFTPTIIGSTTAGVGTYGTQLGRYTKIGRVVTAKLRVTWAAHTGTGNMLVGGLPFTSESVTNSFSAAVIGYANNVTYSATTTPMAYVNINAVTIALAQMPSAGGAMATVGMDIAGDYIISATYFTNT